jgi:diaminopimelate epimerase
VGDKVGVLLAPPEWIASQDKQIDVWNTGVPHAVLFVDALDKVLVEELGRKIRFDQKFQPHGVNVNFASYENGLIRMRTYERGVEGETLACGTGAAAVALSAQKKFKLPSPVQIQASSHDLLEVHINDQEVELVGPVKAVFQGQIRISG